MAFGFGNSDLSRLGGIVKDMGKDFSYRKVWKRWKGFTRRVGNFQARALLFLFYFILVFPIAMVIKIFADPLRLKKKTAHGWVNREEENPSLEQARKGY